MRAYRARELRLKAGEKRISIANSDLSAQHTKTLAITANGG
jgi:hypothetical protein